MKKSLLLHFLTFKKRKWWFFWGIRKVTINYVLASQSKIKDRKCVKLRIVVSSRQNFPWESYYGTHLLLKKGRLIWGIIFIQASKEKGTYSKNKEWYNFHNDKGRFHSNCTEKSNWTKDRKHDKHNTKKTKHYLDPRVIQLKLM